MLAGPGASSRGVAPVDVVVAAVVGAAPAPTLAAVRAGRRVALASRKVLVMAGPSSAGRPPAPGRRSWPVDAEHSAIFPVLAVQRPSTSPAFLTPRAGPCRTCPADDREASFDDRCAPNWSWSEDHRRLGHVMNRASSDEARFSSTPARGGARRPPELIFTRGASSSTDSVSRSGSRLRVPTRLSLSWPERLPLVPRASTSLARRAPLESRPRSFPFLPRLAALAGGEAAPAAPRRERGALARFSPGRLRSGLPAVLGDVLRPSRRAPRPRCPID